VRAEILSIRKLHKNLSESLVILPRSIHPEMVFAYKRYSGKTSLKLIIEFLKNFCYNNYRNQEEVKSMTEYRDWLVIFPNGGQIHFDNKGIAMRNATRKNGIVYECHLAENGSETLIHIN
jgi:hypothetical protein